MTSVPLVLRALEASRDERWDAYVQRHPLGSVYHTLAWRRVIERAFGHQAHYLYAERGAAVTAVLPLFEVGAYPFDRALVSVPVGVQGGVLADDADGAELLRGGARALAERRRLAYVEYKSEQAVLPGLPVKSGLYSTFRQALYPERDRQLAAIPRKTRATLRTAERARLRASFNRTDLEPFYDLYALSLRNLGTPMFPKELFVASLEELPQRCDLLTVRMTGRIVGACLNYYHNDVLLPFYAGTVPEARDVGVNSYLYWAMLETGYARGYRTFDFGRSKVGSGAHAFKRHFGMTELPLDYQYELVNLADVPNVSPTNAKYARAIALWQRLPVPVTKLVGPWVQRRLP